MEYIIYSTTKHFRLRSATEKECDSLLYKYGVQLIVDQTADDGKTYTPVARLTQRYNGEGFNVIGIGRRLYLIRKDTLLDKELDQLKFFAETKLL